MSDAFDDTRTLVDMLVAPDRMSKNEALAVLTELIEHCKASCEALRDEGAEDVP